MNGSPGGNVECAGLGSAIDGSTRSKRASEFSLCSHRRRKVIDRFASSSVWLVRDDDGGAIACTGRRGGVLAGNPVGSRCPCSASSTPKENSSFEASSNCGARSRTNFNQCSGGRAREARGLGDEPGEGEILPSQRAVQSWSNSNSHTRNFRNIGVEVTRDSGSQKQE